jgi:hypothetical protein
MQSRDESLRLASKAEAIAQQVRDPVAKERMLEIARYWREFAAKVAIAASR